ncbi:MAG: solute carrier family 23 protein [Adlercreutzia equolifaciens]
MGNYAPRHAQTRRHSLGILSGFVIAALMGMVDLSGVGTAAWFALPTILPYKIVFDPAACAMIGVVSIVNVVQVMGDFRPCPLRVLIARQRMLSFPVAWLQPAPWAPWLRCLAPFPRSRTART